MNIDRTNPDLHIFYLIDEGPSVLKRQIIKIVVHLLIYLFSGKYESMIVITPVGSIRVSQRRNFLSQQLKKLILHVLCIMNLENIY